MPSWMALTFQDTSSPFMHEISYVYDHVMTIMTIIVVLISYVIICLMVNTSFYKYLSEGTFIETIWSIIPAFLLVFLVIPSMSSLYFVESLSCYHYTIKVVAHQWYWTYIAPFYMNLMMQVNGKLSYYYEYDSIMEQSNSDNETPRLMGCNEDLFLMVESTSRLLVTSADVIHCFSVPSLGLKVDAVPGRINQLSTIPIRLGKFFGQCSEICGSNHTFMPISVSVVSSEMYQEVTTNYICSCLIEMS